MTRSADAETINRGSCSFSSTDRTFCLEAVHVLRLGDSTADSARVAGLGIVPSGAFVNLSSEVSTSFGLASLRSHSGCLPNPSASLFLFGASSLDCKLITLM